MGNGEREVFVAFEVWSPTTLIPIQSIHGLDMSLLEKLRPPPSVNDLSENNDISQKARTGMDQREGRTGSVQEGIFLNRQNRRLGSARKTTV